MKSRSLAASVVAFCLFLIPLSSRADVDPELQGKLSKGYSLTGTGFGSADRITSPGTIYVIRIDGLMARAIANHMTPTNTFKDGALLPPSKGFIASFGVSGDAEQVKPGDRYYLHEIHVNDDSVVFTLISLDSISTVNKGRSVQSRLRLYAKFSIDKKDMNALTPEALHKLSDALFAPEGSPKATSTVQMGQSSADVKKILGDPQKEVNLGNKKILIYKDLKVTLVDDKVTDAE